MTRTTAEKHWKCRMYQILYNARIIIFLISHSLHNIFFKFFDTKIHEMYDFWYNARSTINNLIINWYLCYGFHIMFFYVFYVRFRVFCHKLCNHSNFGNFILCCIMFSSAMLAAENPLKADASRNLVSIYIRFFFVLSLLSLFYIIFSILGFKQVWLLFYGCLHNRTVA